MLGSAPVLQGRAPPLRWGLQGDKEGPEGWWQRPAEVWEIPEGHRGQPQGVTAPLAARRELQVGPQNPAPASAPLGSPQVCAELGGPCPPVCPLSTPGQEAAHRGL